MTTYRSSHARLARILVPAALGLTITMLTYMVRLTGEGLSLFHSALTVAAIGATGLAVKVLNNSAIITLSEKAISIRHGVQLLGTKPKSIPLEYIHTIRIMAGPRKSYSLSGAGLVTLIYKWPAKKMLHAATPFSVAAIPDGNALLLDVAERTGAKIKIHTGAITEETITAEELRKRLGAGRDTETGSTRPHNVQTRS